MSLFTILSLGFFLGMRHATDADHVVAVSTIISRERKLRGAAPVGALWGLGHTATILVVGGAIILFGVVIPPRVGLMMELCVALMLVLLGLLNVRRVWIARADDRHHGAERASSSTERPSLRPLAVGIVHGLAGSAAIALLVLSTIRSAAQAIGYLAVFGVGTVAGMFLITAAFAMPLATIARRFQRAHRILGVVIGAVSVAFGVVLFYQIGFVDGLFTAHPQWTPQ